jgi:hypothetical protein
MAKLTLSTIGSRYGSIDALNANFDAIEEAFENTVSRDGTGPNFLTADLDANSSRIINLPAPTFGHEAVNKQYVDDITGIIAPFIAEITLVGQNINSVITVATNIVDVQNADANAQAAVNAKVAAEAARDTAVAAKDVAVAIADDFDDRYLGVKTSDPTVDNDGDPLQVGALYFNSVASEMRVWNGTNWQPQAATPETLVERNFVATAGQTSYVVSGGYRVNYTFVWVNGLLLNDTDITAVDGVTITFNTPLQLNDEVRILSFKAIGTVAIDDIAGLQTALADKASLTGAETLTNKTLVDPVLTLGAGEGAAGQVPVAQGAGLPPVWGDVQGIATYTYDNRNDLRSVDGPADSYALIQGLGLFKWEAGSTEPDDDESCFATTSGRWLLEAVSWDVVSEWSNLENEIELIGTVDFSSVVTVSGLSGIIQTATISGAKKGDTVLVTPPALLADPPTNIHRLFCYGFCNSPDVVSVVLASPISGTATINPDCRTQWAVRVISK